MWCLVEAAFLCPFKMLLINISVAVADGAAQSNVWDVDRLNNVDDRGSKLLVYMLNSV